MATSSSALSKRPLDVMPWLIAAAKDDDDGLRKDCILVAVMSGQEIESISLHVASKPSKS